MGRRERRKKITVSCISTFNIILKYYTAPEQNMTVELIVIVPVNIQDLFHTANVLIAGDVH